MDEVGAIKVIAEALDQLDKEECVRVLAWAQAKYGVGVAMPPAGNRGGLRSSAGISPAPSIPQDRLPVQPKAKSSRKTKTIISMDKTLNLSPQGKMSAVEFASLKAPSNAKEKCLVAAYYLREVTELTKVSAQGVFTFFKTVQWPVPSDLKNMLQQAGTAGWLDTANSEDIRLTALGENRVEYGLPAKAKV